MAALQRTVHTAEIWRSGELLGPHRLEEVDGRWTRVEPVASVGAPDAGLAVGGLVDLHVHAGLGPFAADLEVFRRSGVRVACSQGDAGWQNIEVWVRAVADAPVDLRLAINLSPLGEAAGDGALERVTPHDVEQVIQAGRAFEHHVRMVAVNLSPRSLGDGPALARLEMGVEAAEALGLPLLVGLAPRERVSFEEQLARLRAGDVITYCYRSEPWCLFPSGEPVASLVTARERGVLLDVGHGKTSFDPQVAAAAIAAGHPPDTISSDLQLATAAGDNPTTLPRTVQRVLSAGMPTAAALRAATTVPLRVLGLPATTLPDFVVGEPAELVDVLPARVTRTG